MNEDESRKTNPNFEVSVGWNSPPPRIPFPESLDSGDVSMNSSSNAGHGDTPKYKDNRMVDHPNTDILGIYSNLLPGSSPPRPRMRVRKRKPESPLKPSSRSNLNLDITDSFRSMTAEPPNAAKRKTNPLSDDEDSNELSDIENASRRTADTKTNEKVKNEDEDDDIVAAEDHDTDSDSDLEDLIKITAPVQFPATYFASKKVQRFVVQRVSITNDVLLLHCTNSENKNQVISLEGSWTDTAVKRGDIVHIIRLNSSRTVAEPESSSYAPIVVGDSTDLYAVVNPDILIPCTSVAEALSCERQVILRSQVRVPADLNESLVLGSIKHEFIQTCFTQNTLDDSNAMKTALRAAVEGSTLDLHLVGLDVPTAMNKLLPVIPGIQNWATSIWGPRAAGRFVDFHNSRDVFKVRISRSAYIEEEIRSPNLGLVGKIDVTCEATDLQNKAGGGTGSRLVGLEIKTGKSTQSISHRAQTSLYTLLLAERHPYNTHPWSLLYYTETGTTIAVTSIPTETRALLQKRNRVAYEMWHLPPNTLPAPTSTSDAICNWCSRSDSCVLYTAVTDKGNTWGLSSLSGVYQKAQESGKLAANFLKFIEHWHYLLELEYETIRRPDQLRSRQWWLNIPDPTLWGVAEPDTSVPVNGFVYTMKPQASKSISASASSSASTSTPSLSVPDSSVQNKDVDIFQDNNSLSLKPEELIIISTKQHMGVTFGIVMSVSTDGIKICVQDKLLSSGKYRIDAESWSSDSHLGLARFNLNCLTEHDRLRELIVDLREPKFSTLSTKKFQTTVEWASNRVLSGSQPGSHEVEASNHGSNDSASISLIDGDEAHEDSADVNKNLNDDQTTALNKVLSAKDYTLILGMPGTGKTTTIAAIVASLVERGKSVLLSAYTNSAVDTIVLKLLTAKIRCLRLATSRMGNIHPDVMPVTVSSNGTSGGGTSLTDFLECPVVACTSHSASNKLFALRKFDYCILDEASQITLPFCIGPLRLSSTFVLVGDHYQLPPLVRNMRAKELGLTESLFKILCEAHPNAVVELKKQYRMCADIMSLSSDLVYDGRLVCGSEAVANQKLELSYSEIDNTFANARAIDPDNHVVFLNTDSLGPQAFEKVHADGTSNHAEALIIDGMIRQFAKAKLYMKNLAVISVYRQQLSYLTERLRPFVEQGLEILTADQAQGRDKSCIIVSLVRSNERSHSGELLKDWRRLNVAFTRAKQKLVIVGSKRTMQRADGVSSFFEYIERRNWVCDASL